MRVTAYTDAGSFSTRLLPLLLEREAENCLMLGNLTALTEGADVSEPTVLAAVEGADGTALAAATMQPPLALVLTRMPPAAVEVLADHLGERGVRVSFVYTPPEHRRRGYATAITAALSRHLFDSGRRVCFLLTDLHNPTANHIYGTIGYERVCDFAHVTFG